MGIKNKMVYPFKCTCKQNKQKSNNFKAKTLSLKKKGFKSYPTKGVKKRVNVPMPMIQTYH